MSADEERLALLKKNAEGAYDRMYDERRPQDCYRDAMELFGEAIDLARTLGKSEEVTALEARRDHVRAVFRSQFSR